MSEYPKERYILFFDIEGSSKMNIGDLSLKSANKQKIHEKFVEIVNRHHPTVVPVDAFRGDDGFAYFKEASDCINASISLYREGNDFIRSISDTDDIGIRIICFKDMIYGSSPNNFTGEALENILPYERDFGASGTLRLISNVNDEGWAKHNVDFIQDELVVNILKGKKRAEYSIWQYRDHSKNVQRFSWNHICDRLKEDLVDNINAMPDLIVISGSMGGSILGGLVYSKLNEKFRKNCQVFHFGTINIDNKTSDYAKQELQKLEKLALNPSIKNVLLIESTRKTGSTCSMLKEQLKNHNVADYVFLYENNKGFSATFSSYSSKGKLVEKRNFLFPW